MTRRAVIVTATIAAVTAVASPLGTKPSPRLVWNASESVPVGLYAVRPVRRFITTDLVVSYAPEPLASFLAKGGYLPRGVPLIKRVLGVPGQTICRDGLLIMVDRIPMGMAREHDSGGRPLPAWQGCRLVLNGELFLMNWDEPRSLDGRYFGPLPVSTIVGRAEPLWTFEEQRQCHSHFKKFLFLCSIEAAPFLRPDRDCVRRRAQWRSRAAVRPARCRALPLTDASTEARSIIVGTASWDWRSVWRPQ